jgi:endonuclease III
MNEKLYYGGTRGHVDVEVNKLSVLFDIGSTQTLMKIRKALGRWIPTEAKYYWETASEREMHVPTKGGFKDTFKFDGEYVVNFPKEALPEVLKAIGYHRSPAQMASTAKMRLLTPRTHETMAQ